MFAQPNVLFPFQGVFIFRCCHIMQMFPSMQGKMSNISELYFSALCNMYLCAYVVFDIRYIYIYIDAYKDFWNISFSAGMKAGIFFAQSVRN